MPKTTELNSLFPYHYFQSLPHELAEHCTAEELWDLCSGIVYELQMLHPIKTHAFVMLERGIHWIFSQNDPNPDYTVQQFQLALRRELNHRKGLSAQWTLLNDYFIEQIFSAPHYKSVISWIYSIPLRMGFHKFPESYPYSTLHGLCGLGHLPFMVQEHRLFHEALPQDLEDFLIWIRNYESLDRIASLRRKSEASKRSS